MPVFLKVDRQKTMDVLQQGWKRIEKTLYRNNRNLPQVTFSSGSAKMCASEVNEENCTGKKLKQNFEAAENFHHNVKKPSQPYKYLLPSTGGMNRPSPFEDSTFSANFSPTPIIDFSKETFSQYFSPSSPKLSSEMQQENKKTFQCENCEKTFQQVEDLQEHIIREHKGARSYPCPECGKAFATASGMKQHFNVHASVKPYSCKVCNKAYTQFSNLCRHKRHNVACQTKKQCQKCAHSFRSTSDSNSICKSCHEKKSSPRSRNEKMKTKTQFKEKLLTQVTSESKDSRSALVLDNSPFPQLEKLCSSVLKIPSTSRSAAGNTLPPRKRLWNAAFLSETVNFQVTVARNATNTVSDARVQCNANNFSQVNINKNNSTSKMNFPSHVTKAQAKCSSSKASNMLKENREVYQGKVSTSNLSFNLSKMPSKKRFLQRAHPNAAAAAIAAEYVNRSSMERKPESVCIANDQQSRFRSSKAYGTNSAKADAEKLIGKEASPLDLSVKRRKRGNSESIVTREDSGKNNAWEQPLNFLYQLGRHYGSLLPSTCQEAGKFYNQPSYLAGLSHQEKNWQQPFSSSFSQQLIVSASNGSPKSQTQPTSSFSSIPNLLAKKDCEMDSKSRAQTIESKKPNRCRYCNRSFSKIANLARHEKTHAGEQRRSRDKLRYSGAGSNKVLSAPSSMHRHVKYVHNQEKTLKSLQCAIKRQFDEQAKQKRHLCQNRSVISDEGDLPIDSSPNSVSAKETNFQANAHYFGSSDCRARERRTFSSSSLDSSESAVPFRPWNQGSNYCDHSSLSLLSFNAPDASEENTTADYFYPDTSSSNALKIMTDQVMTSLLFSGYRAVQA